MTAKAHLWLVGLLVAAVPGCMKFQDIDKARTRYQLREVEKRFEQLNGTYKIGIPDVLNINVPDHPDLSGSYELRPDGNISFPLLRDVYAEGLTAVQLSDLLARELEKYVKKVEVLVTVTGMYSQRVFLGTRSQSSVRAYRFTGDMTILDLISEQGGFTKEAFTSRTRLMRASYEEPEIYHIRLDRIICGEFKTNVLLKKDDFVYLPATTFAEVGYIVDAITYPLRSIISGVRTVTELPYAGRGARERSERASPGAY